MIFSLVFQLLTLFTILFLILKSVELEKNQWTSTCLKWTFCFFFYCFNFLCISKKNKRREKKQMKGINTQWNWKPMIRHTENFCCFFIFHSFTLLFHIFCVYAYVWMFHTFFFFYMCSLLIFSTKYEKMLSMYKTYWRENAHGKLHDERIVCAQNYKHSSLGMKKKKKN